MPSEFLHRERAPSLRLRQLGSGGLHCVLLHGYGDAGYVWDDVAQELAPLYSLTIPDLRGHGDSAWDASGDYRAIAHVADVLDLVKTLGGEPLVLIGHSLGGKVALNVVARCPDRVRALVLVDFGLDGNTSGAEEARSLVRESLETRDSVTGYVDWLAQRRPLVSRKRLMRLAASALAPCEGGFRLKVDPAVTRPDNHDTTPATSGVLWRMLEQIECPSLVVRGAASAVLDPAVAARMARTLRDGALETIQLAGHAVMTDNPRELARVIHEFLRPLTLRPDR